MDNTTDIINLIQRIKNATAPGSVTNSMVARAFEILEKQMGAIPVNHGGVTRFAIGESSTEGIDLELEGTHKDGSQLDEIVTLPMATRSAPGLMSGEMCSGLASLAAAGSIDDMIDAVLTTVGGSKGTKGVWTLNGLTLNRQEALTVIFLGRPMVWRNGIRLSTKLRTNLPVESVVSGWMDDDYLNLAHIAHANTMIEALWLWYDGTSNYVRDMRYMAYKACKLNRIIGTIHVDSQTRMTYAFSGCEALREVRIKGLSGTVDLRDCAVLSYESLLYMVKYSGSEGSKTIVVHPDVYDNLHHNPDWGPVMSNAVGLAVSIVEPE